jgi:hypothetical protein
MSPAILGARTSPLPPADMPCLHVFGDLHFLSTGIFGNTNKPNRMIWDLQRGEVPNVTHHLTVGDLTDNGATSSDAAVQAFAATIGGTWLWTMGNHDVNLLANVRTPAQWGAAYSTPTGTQNYTYDLPWGIRVIVIGFDSMADTTSVIRLSDATLTYLDAQLTAAGSRRCYVVCHAPLYNTVLGTVPSTQSGVYVIGGSSTVVAGATSAEVLAVLGAHNNVAAWICGHSHNEIESAGTVTTVTTNGKTFAHISASCVYYTGTVAEIWDRTASAYVTDYGNKIEVRWRDHAQGRWVAPFGQPQNQVMTATGLTAA